MDINKTSIFHWRILALVLIFNCVLDFLYYIIPDQAISALVRVILNLIYIIVSILLLSNRPPLIAQFLVIMTIYYSIRLLLGVNVIGSFGEFLKFIIGIAFLYISMTSYVGLKELRIFSSILFYTVPMYLLFVIISNLYGVGSHRYTGEVTGTFQVALGDAKLYVPALVIGLYPRMTLMSLIRRSVIRDTLVLAVFLVLVISLRRTAIFIVLALWIPYLVRIISWKLILKPGIIIITAVLLYSTPTLTEIFNRRLESRAYLVENYSLVEEGRYQEISSVLSTFAQSSNPFVSIIGAGDFETAGKYGFRDPSRPIHQDYVYLYFSFGITGLLFYFTFLTLLYRGSKLGYRSNSLNRTYTHLVILFILIGISGNIWAISYKIYILSFIGIFYSAMRNQVNVHEK